LVPDALCWCENWAEIAAKTFRRTSRSRNFCVRRVPSSLSRRRKPFCRRQWRFVASPARTLTPSPGKTNWRRRLCTINLLTKIGGFVKRVNNIFSLKRSWSKLVSIRRSTVLSLPLLIRLPCLMYCFRIRPAGRRIQLFRRILHISLRSLSKFTHANYAEIFDIRLLDLPLILRLINEWNSTIFFLINVNYRGGHWKGIITIYTATEVSLQQKPFSLMNKTVFLITEEKVKP